MASKRTVPETELTRLLEAGIAIGLLLQKQSSTPVGARAWAPGFALKVIRHGASALTLMRERSSIRRSSQRFLDLASTSVVARAGWEGFLLFHHIFLDVTSAEVTEMRWLRWSIEYPMRRQKYVAQTVRERALLACDKVEIMKVKTRIKEMECYSKLDATKKAKFFELDRWRPSWKEMGKRAELTQQIYSDLYSELCEQAHSGWKSVAILGDHTLKQAGEDHRREVAGGALAIAVANIIHGLAYLFPETMSALSGRQRRLITHWLKRGRDE